MTASAPSLTDMFRSYSNGDRSVADAVLREVLPTLRQIAARALGHVRGLGAGNWQLNDRGHFYAIASLAMRPVLVDLERQRTAQRRGCGALHGR